MNDAFLIDLLELLIMLFLFIGIVISIIVSIVGMVKKRNMKKSLIALSVNMVLFTLVAVFSNSHGTYYKYNDWFVLNSNIYDVQARYGEFDSGSIKDGKKGTVGYYIYDDNGPIMPDHLPHFYYIQYDESGTIYKVYDAGAPVG